MNQPSNSKTRRRLARKQYILNNHNLFTCHINYSVICAENFILNLSGQVLSTPEKLLLSKGLSFILTARDVNSFKVIADFNKFAQKLRNQACQYTPRPPQDGFNVFRKTQQQNSQSKPTKFLQFENTLEHMKLALSNLPCNVKVQSNLSHRQKTALINLCKKQRHSNQQSR